MFCANRITIEMNNTLRSVSRASPIVVGGRMAAEMLFFPDVDPLHLRRGGADGDSGQPQSLLEHRLLFGRNLTSPMLPNSLGGKFTMILACKR